MNDTDILQLIKQKDLPQDAETLVFKALDPIPNKHASILSWEILTTQSRLTQPLSTVVDWDEAEALLEIDEEVARDLVNPVADRILLRLVRLLFDERFLAGLEVQNRDSGYSWIVALNKRRTHVTSWDIALLKDSIFSDNRAPSLQEMKDMRYTIEETGLEEADPALADYSRAARCGGFYNGFMLVVRNELAEFNAEEYAEQKSLEEMDDRYIEDAYGAALDYWERHGKKDIEDPEPEVEPVDLTELEKKGEKDVLEVDTDDAPKSYEEMIRSQYREKWEFAVEMEVSEIEAMRVLEKVPREKADKVLESTWEYSKDVSRMETAELGSDDFRMKDVTTYFARLKVCDPTPPTCAPVCSLDSMRFLLSQAALEGMQVYRLHLFKAFAYTPLRSPVYVQPPAGTENVSDMVWKLNTVVYGMSNSWSLLFERIRGIFKDGGLRQSYVEESLFFGPGVFVLVYKGEILVCTKTSRGVDRVKGLLSIGRYQIDCDKNPSWFLGIDLKYVSGSIKLTAKSAIEELAKKYGIKTGSRPLSPMDVSSAVLDLESPFLEPLQVAKYRRMVGVLLYIAKSVRLDISRAIAKLARCTERPTENHMSLLTRVVEYLLGTRNRGIVMLKEAPFSVARTSNGANPGQNSGKYNFKVVCAVDVQERCMGYILQMGGNIINYSAAKLTPLARSEDEAQFVSMCTGIQATNGITNLVEERGEDCGVIRLCGDSRSALSQYLGKAENKMPMHVSTQYHYVRQLITELKECVPYFVSPENNTARMITTIMDPKEHSKLLKMVTK